MPPKSVKGELLAHSIFDVIFKERPIIYKFRALAAESFMRG